MANPRLEHVNMTVRDPDETARMLVEILGWHIRWAGDSLGGGRTVHVGNDADYVALYSANNPRRKKRGENYTASGGLNHLGILVDDLDHIEERVQAYGLKTHSHQTYEPGSRFYFHDTDNIEYEVVSYAEN